MARTYHKHVCGLVGVLCGCGSIDRGRSRHTPSYYVRAQPILLPPLPDPKNPASPQAPAEADRHRDTHRHKRPSQRTFSENSPDMRTMRLRAWARAAMGAAGMKAAAEPRRAKRAITRMVGGWGGGGRICLVWWVDGVSLCGAVRGVGCGGPGRQRLCPKGRPAGSRRQGQAAGGRGAEGKKRRRGTICWGATRCDCVEARLDFNHALGALARPQSSEDGALGAAGGSGCANPRANNQERRPRKKANESMHSTQHERTRRATWAGGGRLRGHDKPLLSTLRPRHPTCGRFAAAIHGDGSIWGTRPSISGPTEAESNEIGRPGGGCGHKLRPPRGGWVGVMQRGDEDDAALATRSLRAGSDRVRRSFFPSLSGDCCVATGRLWGPRVDM